jgi:hypothetical protein
MSLASQSFTAHIRRLSTAGSVLYIRIASSDILRLGLRHGQNVEIDLGSVRVTGMLKTSGGSPWLAPSPGGSNSAITSALRGASLSHGMDVPATLHCLGVSPTWSESADLSQPSSAVRPSGVRVPTSVGASSAQVQIVQGKYLWDRITTRLTTFLPTWRTRIA